mmetsp:Transcript_9442/g.11022  ORF Transcript_9442/g.11022 Transcript_9442/m.11022 type:complete len:747 (+) Transcript_9442:82-2322(+)
MAEQVQEVLDRMVPALRDLMDKGIFSENEIRAIVTRRRTSEYLLRRRAPRKTDYSRYIEAEENLEKLRSIRNKRSLARKAAKERSDKECKGDGGIEDGTETKKKKNGSSSIGDASIVQHIHLLFVRAKRKWKQDLSWHLQHAEFAKRSFSFTILGKIYAEALQIHPRNASLWIEAASHEFFGYVASSNSYGMSGGGSIKNARILLQRGLRINPTLKELWLQYFCLELHYIQKLRGRRELLQLGKRTILTDKDKDDADDNDNDAEPNGNGGLSQIEALYEDATLPRVIYKNAIKNIPEDVPFRLAFVECCRRFPKTEVVEGDVMSSVEADFGTLEEAWIARATYIVASGGGGVTEVGFLKGNDGDDDDDDDDDDEGAESRKRKRVNDNDDDNQTSVETSIIQLLEEATTTVSTSKMYIQSISFLRHHLIQLSQHEDTHNYDDKMMIIANYLPLLLQKSQSKQITTTSPELTILTADVLVELGHPLEAAQSLQRAIKDAASPCRTTARCYIRWAEISQRMELLNQPVAAIGITPSNPHRPRMILRRALDVIPLYDGGYYDLLSTLFLHLLTNTTTATSSSKSRNRKSKAQRIAKEEEEISSLFEKLILLHHRRKTPTTTSTPLPTTDSTTGVGLYLPCLSLAYFRHLLFHKGDVHAARRVYRQVLFDSNYVAMGSSSLEEEEVDATLEFYESCIAMENSMGDDEISRGGVGGSVAVRKLYDGVIGFLEGREDIRAADLFRKRKVEDLV